MDRFGYETIEQTDCIRVEFIFAVDGRFRCSGRNRFQSFSSGREYHCYAFGSPPTASASPAAASPTTSLSGYV
jgi:hypothetical protein